MIYRIALAVFILMTSLNSGEVSRTSYEDSEEIGEMDEDIIMIDDDEFEDD